jgi:tetratricopeptide (TPR) repeat protein
MSQPLLALNHDWHRQRAHLRSGRMRPPPLVAAGIDLAQASDSSRVVNLGGLAVIFGVFPASLAEFLELARLRLHLGAGQARELDAVLNTRILAMWAWLPTLRQDCYLELDRATGEEHLWQVGPGPGEGVELVIEASHEELDTAFLDALVLNGPGHWGGESGLAKLVERFGRQPLLVAAQVADLLDHQPKEPQRALELARARWPELSQEQESGWVPLADTEHPWVAVQLGRLALRLGLVRAARLLLRQGGHTDVAPVAHFDLGQACEALGDLQAAESAFARYAAARPSDPDAWRRLLLCRLRLGHFTVAEETLRRYRSSGGKDHDLAERFLGTVARGTLRGDQRANLVGWLCARLQESMQRRLPLPRLIEEICERRGGSDPEHAALQLTALIDCLRLELADSLTEQAPSRIDDVVRVALLALPLHDRHRSARNLLPENVATHACDALMLWSTLALGPDRLSRLPEGQALLALARFACSAPR